MNDDPRPWWASSSDDADIATDGARTTTEDPVQAHRAARRGPTSPPGAPGDGCWGDAHATGHAVHDATGDGAGSSTTSRPSEPSEPSEPARSHADAVCGVCPVCVLARTLGDTHPELLGHLTEAARHLTAAARAILDTPPPRDAGPDRVQRIDLD